MLCKYIMQLTAQELFDRILDYARRTQKRAIDQDRPYYRLPNTCIKSFAGSLIPDDEYYPELEDYDWYKLIGKGLVPANHKNLIVALDEIHNEWSQAYWADLFQKVATNFKLNYMN